MLAPSEYFPCLLKTQATSTRWRHPTSKLSTGPLNAWNDSGRDMDWTLFWTTVASFVKLTEMDGQKNTTQECMR